MGAIREITRVLQLIVVEGIALSNPQKHKVAKDLIDRAIRLPFWAEPFDGILIDAIIKFAVAQMKLVNWGFEQGGAVTKLAFRDGKLANVA